MDIVFFHAIAMLFVGGIRKFQIEKILLSMGHFLIYFSLVLENTLFLVFLQFGKSFMIDNLYAYNSLFTVISAIGLLFIFFLIYT